ncbi:hypothetical protein SAMN05444583_1322 [Rhodococcus maanshanensis]|uniref:Uncharacterized protein n=1 Tax=Rhodococcus maanshanensis TaxID=183556 RepID=A0A1H7XDC9_9NOCA|nr:hypothetical protein SAMN05444583_1322 [Rhodococcus maanshanensis]
MAGSRSDNNYYAVAMQFRRSDGSTSHGVWGLGGGPVPTEGQALTVIATGAPLVNVDQSAWEHTV